MGSSSLSILHEPSLVALHPAEPDLCSSALPASCLQVARQLDCSFFRSRHLSILFSVPGSQRECVPETVRVHSVVVGTTHASRVALRLFQQSNFDTLYEEALLGSVSTQDHPSWSVASKSG